MPPRRLRTARFRLKAAVQTGIQSKKTLGNVTRGLNN